jgi:peptidoglycan/xylan/chitin deacetylase (PgdA/CDA1 family)
MYHYVRDLPNTAFPGIKGMLLQDFCKQVTALASRYEMATLESALDFLDGRYTPARDLCLLTFDDGLKEHYLEVTPLLISRGIQGVFFVITSCMGGNNIAPVHMNHFLMAAVDFEDYRSAFLAKVAALFPDCVESTFVDPDLAQKTYRWDEPKVANFKYLFNFVLDSRLRNLILQELFKEKIGAIPSFASELYFNEEQAREMQAEGMVLGGHSHQHRPLSSLTAEELQSDLEQCHQILEESLYAQSLWPFCYPYGKKDSFTDTVAKRLKTLGFNCSFSTEIGSNPLNTNRFALRRLDCKDVHVNTGEINLY